MRSTGFHAVVFAAGLAFAALSYNAAGDSKDADSLSGLNAKQLVEKLGDNNYLIRDAAQKRLVEMGDEASGALREALNHSDPEVKQRAGVIIETIKRNTEARQNKAILDKTLWRLRVPAGVPGQIEVRDGMVCFADTQGQLKMLDAMKGGKKGATASDDGESKSPCVATAGGMVFVSEFFGGLTAVDGAGKKKWKLGDVEWTSAPTISDGLVYVGCDSGLVALDANSGTEKWKVKLAAGVGCRPAVADGAVYFTDMGSTAYAVDAGTGKLKWKAEGLGGQFGHALVGGGRLFIRSSGKVLAIDCATGKKLWDSAATGMSGTTKVEVKINNKSAPAQALYEFRTPFEGMAVSDAGLYLTASHKLIALDPAGGKELWSRQLEIPKEAKLFGYQLFSQAVMSGGGGNAQMQTGQLDWWWAFPPAVHDGVVYVGGLDGLRTMDAKTGKDIWKFTSRCPVFGRPVVDGDVLYFATAAAIPLGNYEGRMVLNSPQQAIDVPGFPEDAERTETPCVSAIKIAGLAQTRPAGN